MKAIGAGGIAGLAGCSGNEGGGDNDGGGGNDGTTGETVGNGGDEKEPISIHYGVLFTRDNFSHVTHDAIFIEKIKELSDREVEFEFTKADALGGPTEMSSLIEKKTVNMGRMAPSYTPDTFPYDSVAALPGITLDAKKTTQAYWELVDPSDSGMIYEKSYKDQGLRPMSVFLWPPYQLFSVDTKITAMDDFKKLNLRAPGGAQILTAKALGANPIDMTAPESLQAMERGTLDAIMFPPTVIRSFGFEELVGYGTTNLPLVSFANNIVVNQEVFDSYPEDFQKTLVQAGRETNMEAVETSESKYESEYQAMEDAGVTIYDVDESVVGNVEEALEPVPDQWADQRNEFAEKVLNQFVDSVESL